MRGYFLFALVVIGLPLGGCGGGTHGELQTGRAVPANSNAGTPAGGVTRAIEALVETPSPTRILVRNGGLFWQESSDFPLNRLSLADHQRTAFFQALPRPEAALSDGTDIYWV